MKVNPNKREIRKDLDQQVVDFLSHGGNINEIDRGISGLSPDQPWLNPFKSTESEKPSSRTPVSDVLATIDARRKAKKPTPVKNRKPQKKWIYDDFGEPVRWVWSDGSQK